MQQLRNVYDMIFSHIGAPSYIKENYYVEVRIYREDVLWEKKNLKVIYLKHSH